MFYRRKIILSLLQVFDFELQRIQFQKLLFLFCKKQAKAEYDFIPYRFGCYSYSANADIYTMIGKDIVEEVGANIRSKDKADYVKTLKEQDRKLLYEVKNLYGKMSINALMKHTYLNYPYWAINSEKASSLLSSSELEKVKQSRPQNNEIVLYTIGYEGISLEEYLNRLLRNDVKVLVDVRNNPMSMKYGFNKSQLKKFCDNLNIQYLHFPEVGIQSDERQTLKTQTDYDRLFDHYKENNLTKTLETQQKLFDLLMQYKRIAFICFEANIDQCHRKHLAQAITKLPNFKYEVKHI